MLNRDSYSIEIMLNLSLFTFCVLRSSGISPITSSDYAWIAESLNPTHDPGVLWFFHQKIVVACITYTLLTHYYMYYLSKNSKIRKLRAKRWKLKAKN